MPPHCATRVIDIAREYSIARQLFANRITEHAQRPDTGTRLTSPW